MPLAAVMSFMSVPALDRLLEPSSEIESTSVRSWSARAERRSAINMSPLFPSHQPHSQPSPPQARSSPPPFSPSPYVLNFKRRVFEGANDGSVEAGSFGGDVPAQPGGGQLREATSSVRGEKEVVLDVGRNASNSKAVLNEDGVLPVREVQGRLSLGGNSFKGHDRPRGKISDKIEELMSKPVIKPVEAKYDGRRQDEFGREYRSRSASSGQQDCEFSSVSSSNREEFFDAPEEPFDGRFSTSC